MRFPLPLSLLLLAPLLAAGPASAQGESGLSARLDLQRGRALFVDRSGVVALKSSAGPFVISGQGHLELAPGARASLSWPGQASLTLLGPASFAWRGAAGPRFLWTFTALNEVEVEIRTREARVDLPDSWRVRLGRGAYSLSALPGGGSSLEHRAGDPAQASWLGGEGVSPPPVPVGPGERARLAGEPRYESVADRTARARRWDASSWPWGDGGIPAVPDLLTGESKPWASEEWPWKETPLGVEAWERWDWPWHVPEPAAPPSAAPSAPIDSDPALDEQPELLPGLASPPGASPAHDPALWRGLSARQLEAHRGFRLQRSPDWQIEELPSGRVRIRLDRDTLEPAWFLGSELDYRLFPGGELILEADGRVRTHRGWIRILEATPGRRL